MIACIGIHIMGCIVKLGISCCIMAKSLLCHIWYRKTYHKQIGWTNSKQYHETTNGVKIQLMAIGLEKEVTVITDSTVESVFVQKYPSHPPTVPKMKGGVFIPLTCNDLFA